MSARPLTDAQKQERYRLQRIAHGASLKAGGYRALAMKAAAGILPEPGPWSKACASAEPAEMCAACDCWKIGRAYCS